MSASIRAEITAVIDSKSEFALTLPGNSDDDVTVHCEPQLKGAWLVDASQRLCTGKQYIDTTPQKMDTPQLIAMCTYLAKRVHKVINIDAINDAEDEDYEPSSDSDDDDDDDDDEWIDSDSA